DHLPRAGVEVPLDLFDPHVWRHDELSVLVAHLREHRELARLLFDQLSLDPRLERDRPVRDLHVAQPQLPHPAAQALHAPLPDRELRERAPEHHRDAMRLVALQLGREVRAYNGRSPAELDHVHAIAGHLQQAVHLRHRQAPVDHMRESPLARLGRALGDVQEASYGTVAALSRPTITTTVAEPDT